MTRKKINLLEQDSTLRLIYAFNYFTSLNETWEEDSKVTIHNREISKQLGISCDDDYFMFGNRFYSINYQMTTEDLINCEIKEYDNFYDMSTKFLVMKFEFSISTKDIRIYDEKLKKISKKEIIHQKRMKVA